MTELEKLCEQALYEEIQDLGDGKTIVRDVPTGRLFYRKILTVYNTQVFAYLKDHKSRYVPRVESFREDENKLIVIEELVQGRTLEEILGSEDEPLSFQERIRILTELCDGLSFLHSAQPPIIHRDLKASNVMLTEDGVVKIIDYDAAKIYISGEKKDTVLMGTHGVAAPEQYGFAASDVRTDIFGLGKLIERMLPGNVDAARIVSRATHMDPKKRYSSAAQIREQIVRIREHSAALDTFLEKVIPGFDPRRKSSRVLGRLFIAVLCAAILGGGAFAVWRYAVYPGQRREAMRAGVQTIQSAAENDNDAAGTIERFLAEYPYGKMNPEEQLFFRNSMEKALAEYTAADTRTEELYTALSNCGVDEEAIGAIREYAKVERYLSTSAFTSAFETLQSLRDSGTMDAEEKWTDALKRCMKAAISEEEAFNEEGILYRAKRAMELYRLIMTCGDRELTADAQESFDRVFQTLLDQADAESKSGKHDEAEEKYVLMQDFQDTFHASEVDIEDKRTANQDMLDEKIRADKYSKAESLVEDEDYTNAADIFEELGDYKDAPDRLQKCRYLTAGRHMEKEEYKLAERAYKLCSGYEDADERRIEAKYRHCASVCEKPDDDAYTWIEELVADGYPGAQDVQNTMYQWHAEIKNEVNLIMGSQQSVHIRAYLYGGPPDASTYIRFETIDNVTGEKTSWTSPNATSRGGYDDASYNINTFEYSLFEREYTVNVYSDDGRQIGTWTGIFTKDFTM